jgi:hypothetical protein
LSPMLSVTHDCPLFCILSPMLPVSHDCPLFCI